MKLKYHSFKPRENAVVTETEKDDFYVSQGDPVSI